MTTVVGLSMLAGWLSAFRNRAYLGWLGGAFLALSGYLIFRDRAVVAQEMETSDPQAVLLANLCLGAAALAFVLALVAATLETTRRIRAIQERHRAAEDALLAVIHAAREREAGKGADAGGGQEQAAGDKPGGEPPDSA